MQIHSTALVHPKAELASDVEIQAFSIVGEHVTIGSGTVVGPHCVISGRTKIGKNNRIYSSAQVGVLSQDLKHQDDGTGRTVVGDDNIIREFVTVSTSTQHHEDPSMATAIGNNCLLMACSHVAHDCILGDDVIIANSSALAGHVEVQDGVIIGGLTGVHQFVTLGTMAFIGGMTRVRKDAPPYMIVEGHDPRCCGPNTVGLQRSGLEKEAIGRIKKMYKLLYRSDLNTKQAQARIEEEIAGSAERTCMLDFIASSRRGLT